MFVSACDVLRCGGRLQVSLSALCTDTGEVLLACSTEATTWSVAPPITPSGVCVCVYIHVQDLSV